MGLLDLNAQTTTRLGLEPIKNPNGGYLYEGIVPAKVTDFHITYQEHEKGEFAGLSVPVLQIEFENLKLNPNEPDKFYTHSFKPIGTKQLVKGTTDQYEDRGADDIENDTQNLWKGIKHFLESLAGQPHYRNILNIPKEDVPKYFDLPGIGVAKERLEKYEAFFKYLCTFVMGDGKDIKPQIVDADGKPIPMWVKMTPNYDKDPKRDKKYYTVSRYINQGVFEPMKLNKEGLPLSGPKILRIKPSESLALSTGVTVPAGAQGANAFTNLPGGIDPSVANLLK